MVGSCCLLFHPTLGCNLPSTPATTSTPNSSPNTDWSIGHLHVANHHLPPATGSQDSYHSFLVSDRFTQHYATHRSVASSLPEWLLYHLVTQPYSTAHHCSLLHCSILSAGVLFLSKSFQVLVAKAVVLPCIDHPKH